MPNQLIPKFEERAVEILLDGGFLTQDLMDDAKTTSELKSSSLLDVIVTEGMMGQETLTTVLDLHLGIPVVDLKQINVDLDALALLPEKDARQYCVMPIGFESDGSLRIATLMPEDSKLSSKFSDITGCPTTLVLAIGGNLEETIDRIFIANSASADEDGAPEVISPPEDGAPEAISPPEDSAPEAISPPEDADPEVISLPNAGGACTLLGQDLSNRPVMEAVDMVTLKAVESNASDILLVPSDYSAKILFRRNGELQQMVELTLTLHENMVSRIKVEAGMDMSEDRWPQDGGFRLNVGERRVEFRVTSMGTTWGEMMVIRVLDHFGGFLSLESLGMESQSLQTWRALLESPYGMLLVSGPTGSGKTTTLYASVAELIGTRGNIMSVEDPIEYRMNGVNQIQVDRAAGINFPSGLNSILRLDPDVILVGEIRDPETATAAMNAALTGHLVLASIHGSDAASSIVRLLELGVEPVLAATGVIGCLAQRLVRQICPHCGITTEATPTEAIAFEHNQDPSAGADAAADPG